MTTLTIYRPPSTVIATINIDEKTVFAKRLMAEHYIKCEFIYASVIALQIGDFITYNSENYCINRLPDIEKINSSTFKYAISFESILYNLNRKLFISADGLADYSYNGSATDFITNLVASINEIDSGWTVGTVDASDDLTLQFNNESCRAALTRVAEAFSMEFSLSGKVISLVNSVGSTTAYKFEYGRDLGLYKLTRQQVQDQNILTKVYGFGGTKNIPSTYRSRAKRLTFAVSGQAASGYLVSAASGLYGTIEGQYTDDEIYPKRTSTLTDVNMVFDAGTGGTDFNNRTSYIEDSALDFDINNYLIEGLTAKVVFKSGDMSGVECEIWKYDAANKLIYINPSTDRDGYTLPFYNSGSPVIPSIGDSYTLVDMEMPAAYVTAAETSLRVATQTFLDENSVPQVVYSVDIDPKYAASVSLDIDAGDRVTVIDTDLGVNSLIRVSGIEFPLVNPYQIKAVIADFVPYTLQERIVKQAKDNKHNIVTVNKDAEELGRLNALRLHSEKAKNTVPMYQGTYASGTTYYGNPSRLDIVKYNIPADDPDAGEIYFIARVDAPSESFSGIVPTNTDYWKRFDAQYSSIATQLLFAELAYIDNLGVKYFNGVPVPVGDLDGSVVNTQTNRVAVKQKIRFTKIADGTDLTIVINGANLFQEWNTSAIQTCADFWATYGADAWANVTLSYPGAGNYLDVEADVAGTAFTYDSSGVTESVISANVTAQARIDTITLTGTSGTANILCDGVTSLAEFFNSLTESAAGFVELYAADYLAGGVVVTSSGPDVIFEAEIAGVNFTGSTTIANVANTWRGSLKIEGNQLYENAEDNDTYGYVTINYVGYNGGVTRYRRFIVGNGRGSVLLNVGGDTDGGYTTIRTRLVTMAQIPTSAAGLSGGMIYRSGNDLKIV